VKILLDQELIITSGREGHCAALPGRRGSLLPEPAVPVGPPRWSWWLWSLGACRVMQHSASTPTRPLVTRRTSG